MVEQTSRPGRCWRASREAEEARTTSERAEWTSAAHPGQSPQTLSPRGNLTSTVAGVRRLGDGRRHVGLLTAKEAPEKARFTHRVVRSGRREETPRLDGTDQRGRRGQRAPPHGSRDA